MRAGVIGFEVFTYLMSRAELVGTGLATSAIGSRKCSERGIDLTPPLQKKYD